MVRLSCHGAARQVTGSCHLVHSSHHRLLIDCGFFQGGHEIEEENDRPFGFDPRSIDFVLLTHAHLDHCGRLPLLYRQGFRGRIVATAATRELTRLVLTDAAGLQEENARHRNHHAREPLAVQNPLYTSVDVEATLQRFADPVDYGVRQALAPGIHATFVDAGHILGSASVFLELEEEGRERPLSLFFSGDIGEPGRPLLADAAPPPRPPDYVIMETTYGDRDHRPWGATVEELLAALEHAVRVRGKALVPTFALERAQDILYVLSAAFDANRLESSLPVYLDSPMAISATETFRHHAKDLRPEAARLLEERDPFSRDNLHYTKDVAASKDIDAQAGAAVIMAGSGMCTGGRIRHHLAHHLASPTTTLIFVGYAAAGTLARRIIDGAQSVSLFGSEIPVRAEIHTINGFSAHAGRSQLLAWLKRCGQPRRVFLVHGDQERGMAAFAQLLERETTLAWTMPRDGEVYELG